MFYIFNFLYYKINKKGNGGIFLDYLKYLTKEFKGKKILLVLDNGPIHKTKEVKEYVLKNNDKIELCFLPPYSPKLNAIEKLWREIKRESMHGKYFKNKNEFLECLEQALIDINSETAIVLGVMDKWVKMYKNIISKIERWEEIKAIFNQALG